MTEYRDVLERELDRLAPPRIPVDRLVRRRDRRRRNQRVTAAFVAVTVSLLTIAGLIRAFGAGSETGDRTLEPAAADISFVNLRTGMAHPLARSITTVPEVGSVQVSPDGSTFAFEGARKVGALHQIYFADVDGTDLRQITDDDLIEARYPRWSPDGSTIVFQGSDGGDVDIFVLDAATGETTRLTRGLASTPVVIDLMPAFTSDGEAILFTQADPGDVDLWTIPVTGGEPSRVRENAALGSTSPDGSALAFRRATADGSTLGLGSIYVASGEGSRPRLLGRGGMSMGGFVFWEGEEVNASGPIWSPDGTRLLVLAPYSTRGPVGAHLVDIETGEHTDLGRAHEASWFDDATLIVRGYGAP